MIPPICCKGYTTLQNAMTDFKECQAVLVMKKKHNSRYKTKFSCITNTVILISKTNFDWIK